ncbi:GNAT family N-acetyltransferase [Bacillus sp. SD088]|uniref:GNAT family N-acetyltransferase n=1 Tax=Bacillus sp. SD088 TaxID=2782012 RepID=UPI001A96122E|nr:GNAT family N-acetyltransferase [Bacillus sp. SD088]MBO0996065.1 GNAT family N-acetyltransferase [Bacillus sp. SD088]
MEIRLLNPLDAKNYLDLRLEALQTNPEAFASSYEEEKDQSVEKYESRFQSQDSLTFGAFENEKLIGVVTLVVEKKKKLKHRANIFAMYVSPEKRGIGVGKNLMLEAIKKAKGLEGIEQVYLTVVTTNDLAKRLYSSLGFKKFGEDKRAIKLGNRYFDEELMVLFF